MDNSEASSKQELKTENKPEQRKYTLDDFSGVHWANEPSDWHRCGICGFTRLTSCQGDTFKKETLWLCESCKEKWENRRQLAECQFDLGDVAGTIPGSDS